MKKMVKTVKPSKLTIKLSTKVKAGAYTSVSLSLGAGKGKSGV